MKRNALRPVALVVRSALAVILFSLVVPPLTQAALQHSFLMRHPDCSDSIQPEAVRVRVTFGAGEELRSGDDERAAGMQAIELGHAPEAEYRSIDTRCSSADKVPKLQHRRSIAGASFTPNAAYSSVPQDWAYPTTCDVRSWRVASSQPRYQGVVLLGYSDQTCAGGWNRLPLSVHEGSQLMFQREHRVTQGHVRHASTLKLASRKSFKQVAWP